MFYDFSKKPKKSNRSNRSTPRSTGSRQAPQHHPLAAARRNSNDDSFDPLHVAQQHYDDGERSPMIAGNVASDNEGHDRYEEQIPQSYGQGEPGRGGGGGGGGVVSRLLQQRYPLPPQQPIPDIRYIENDKLNRMVGNSKSPRDKHEEEEPSPLPPKLNFNDTFLAETDMRRSSLATKNRSESDEFVDESLGDIKLSKMSSNSKYDRDQNGQDTDRPPTSRLPDDPWEWTAENVATWLEGIQLHPISEIFYFHRVDGPVLLALNMHDVKVELCVSEFGYRSRLFRKISSLKHRKAAYRHGWRWDMLNNRAITRDIVLTWNGQDILKYLTGVGLAGYHKEFARHKIDGEAFLELNDDILTRDLLVMPFGHRRRLLNFVIYLMSDDLKERDPTDPRLLAEDVRDTQLLQTIPDDKPMAGEGYETETPPKKKRMWERLRRNHLLWIAVDLAVRKRKAAEERAQISKWLLFRVDLLNFVMVFFLGLSYIGSFGLLAKLKVASDAFARRKVVEDQFQIFKHNLKQFMLLPFGTMYQNLGIPFNERVVIGLNMIAVFYPILLVAAIMPEVTSGTQGLVAVGALVLFLNIIVLLALMSARKIPLQSRIAIPSKKIRIKSPGNVAALGVIAVEFFQMNALSLRHLKTLMSEDQMAVVGAAVGDMGGSHVTSFLLLIAVEVILVIVIKLSKDIPHPFLPLFTDTLYMTIMNQILTAVDCTYDSDTGDSYMDINPSVECWEGIHVAIGLHGFFALVYFFPLATSYPAGAYEMFMKSNKDVRYTPIFVMATHLLKAVLTFISIFFSDIETLSFVMFMVVCAALAIITMRIQPCCVPEINAVKTAVYASVACSNFAALVSGSSGVAFAVLLVICWIVIGIATTLWIKLRHKTTFQLAEIGVKTLLSEDHNIRSYERPLEAVHALACDPSHKSDVVDFLPSLVKIIDVDDYRIKCDIGYIVSSLIRSDCSVAIQTRIYDTGMLQKISLLLLERNPFIQRSGATALVDLSSADDEVVIRLAKLGVVEMLLLLSDSRQPDICSKALFGVEALSRNYEIRKYFSDHKGLSSLLQKVSSSRYDSECIPAMKTLYNLSMYQDTNVGQILSPDDLDRIADNIDIQHIALREAAANLLQTLLRDQSRRAWRRILINRQPIGVHLKCIEILKMMAMRIQFDPSPPNVLPFVDLLLVFASDDAVLISLVQHDIVDQLQAILGVADQQTRMRCNKLLDRVVGDTSDLQMAIAKAHHKEDQIESARTREVSNGAVLTADEADETKLGALDAYFKISHNGSTVTREILGGLTSFMVSAYIMEYQRTVFANNAFVDEDSMYFTTAIISGIGTTLAGVVAHLPMVIAPGLGMNFYYSDLVTDRAVTCCPEDTSCDPDASLKAVNGYTFFQGVFMIAIVFFAVNGQTLQAAFPDNYRVAVGIGIGLFVGFVGASNMRIISFPFGAPAPTPNYDWKIVLGFLTIVFVVALATKGNELAFAGPLALFTVIYTAIISDEVAAPSWSYLGDQVTANWGKVDLILDPNFDWFFPLLTMTLEHIFDSGATALTIIQYAFFFSQDYEPEHFVEAVLGSPKLRNVLLVDAFASCIGAWMGSSSTVCFIESAAAVMSGARTGLASVVTGVLFFVSSLTGPVTSSYFPLEIRGAILFSIGVMLIAAVKNVSFDKFKDWFPAFFAAIWIPFGFNPMNGITGSYTVMVLGWLLSGKWKHLNSANITVTFLCIVVILSKFEFAQPGTTEKTACDSSVVV